MRLLRMCLCDSAQPAHERCDDERGDQKGCERNKILYVRNLEVIARWDEKIGEASNRDHREQGRRYGTVEQGQDDDNDEIDESGACRSQGNSETHCRRDRQRCNARDPQRCQVTDSSEAQSLHVQQRVVAQAAAYNYSSHLSTRTGSRPVGEGRRAPRAFQDFAIVLVLKRWHSRLSLARCAPGCEAWPGHSRNHFEGAAHDWDSTGDGRRPEKHSTLDRAGAGSGR